MAFLKNLKLRGVLVPLFLGILAAGYVGCGGKKETTEKSEHRVKGTVTYQRIPIKVNDDGYPIGLESPSDAEEMPLRGAFVRAVYSTEETMPDESKVTVWLQSDYGYTDSEGNYNLALPDDDTLPAFVEIQSVFNFSGTNPMRIIADPKGIHSDVPQADRVIYSMRKGLDDSHPSDNPMPAAAMEGEVQLDFDIGIEDKWWISHPSRGNSIKYAQYAELEPIGTGSKIAAIIDTAYKAALYFGSATPDATLDLHYRQGRTERFGTYVEFDREKFPLAFDPGTAIGGGALHYFGSVRGGPSPKSDDAWDEGALLTMMARSNFRSFGVLSRFQLPPKRGANIDDPINQLTTINLHPSMALVEGLPEAMAAITLGTPYITSGSGTAVRDIRDLSGLPKDVFSGPAIAALVWEIALKANEVESPGDPSAWAEIDPASVARLYSPQSVTEVDEETGAVTEVIDLPSVFTMLTRLAYSAGLGEPIDLAAIFTDEVISQLTEPLFGPIWPRPDEGELSCFIKDWGTDPDSRSKQIPSFILSMSDSALDASGNYSNITKNEHFTAKINLSKDTPYLLSVATEPPLPDGTSVELRINGNALSPYIFNSASSGPKRIVLTGNAEYYSYYLLDFSIKSPTVKVGNDIRVQVRFDPSY